MTKTHGLRYKITEIAIKRKNRKSKNRKREKGKTEKRKNRKNVLAVYVFGPRLETVSIVVVLTFFLLDRISRPYF